MKKLLALILPALVLGCTTAQLNESAQIALPIAEAAAVAAGAYYGVPPSTSTAVIGAVNSLWGAYAQAQAGQPVSQGAVAPAIGNAIQAAIPAGTPQTKTIAALQTAATLLQIQVPAATK